MCSEIPCSISLFFIEKTDRGMKPISSSSSDQTSTNWRLDDVPKSCIRSVNISGSDSRGMKLFFCIPLFITRVTQMVLVALKLPLRKGSRLMRWGWHCMFDTHLSQALEFLNHVLEIICNHWNDRTFIFLLQSNSLINTSDFNTLIQYYCSSVSVNRQ